jgi:formylglycine-generating enzyme required for sulfatase activity
VDAVCVEDSKNVLESRVSSDSFGLDGLDLCTGAQPLTWIPIPGGAFNMGCSPLDDNCGSNEKPSHAVTLSPFEMLQTEVTESQYEQVMAQNPSCDPFGRGPCYPVECVLWADAKAFCEAVGGRLPTEAEWEYAARAGTETKFYCGNDLACLSEIAWWTNAHFGSKAPVGLKAPNGYGLYDTLGNVFEWTGDWYDYYGYLPTQSQDPVGPDSGLLRVVRGGYWFSPAGELRVSFRSAWLPSYASYKDGFRCVREVNR